MMDCFDDEFSLIQSTDNLKAIDSLIYSQEESIKSIQKKLYIFRVLALTEEIKNLYRKDSATYAESTIKISKHYDWDFGWMLRTGVRLSDRYQYHNPTSEVRTIFDRLETIKIYNQEYASKELLPNIEFYFDFSQYEKVKKLLLSDEIMRTIDYYNLKYTTKNSNKKDVLKKI